MSTPEQHLFDQFAKELKSAKWHGCVRDQNPWLNIDTSHRTPLGHLVVLGRVSVVQEILKQALDNSTSEHSIDVGINRAWFKILQAPKKAKEALLQAFVTQGWIPILKHIKTLKNVMNMRGPCC